MSHKQEKVYNILRISPASEDMSSKLTEGFKKRLKDKNLVQNKFFNIIVNPLTYKQYKLYTNNRYTSKHILMIMNNHIISKEVGLSYIMQFPYLVKLVIDGVYSISGQNIDEINHNPQKLFDTLKENRQKLSTVDSLVDQLILANSDINVFFKINDLETYEERLMLAALIELNSQVILEERYGMANRLGTPMKLTPDRNFGKEYERVMNSDMSGNEMDAVFAETGKALATQTDKDKQYEKLGIKKAVNTNNENQAYSDL